MPEKSSVKSARFSRRYWFRLTTFIVVVASIAFIFLLVYFIDLQIKAFVTPHRDRDIGLPTEISSDYKNVTLTTADGLKISGWYFSGTRPNAIVLAHGVGGNRKGVLPEAKILAQAGYHLLLIDLRGHGRSEGDMISYGYGEALDVRAAVDYLAVLPEVEQVGALGTSFGGAAVVRAAAVDRRIRAVVIESSFSSLPAAVEDAFDDLSIFPQWPFAPLLVDLAERRVGLEIDRVDSARDLATMPPRPVLIIHGSTDDLFPLDHAEKMYRSAQEPKELWVVEGMGHQNPVEGREQEYRQRVVTFFERAFAWP
ncbi:MAG: alpha/beta fold hydrolase [Anaerolineae bacterium]|nr:alpha/beta fold hydrolase [Anaerolineae bacterium]